MKDKKVIRQTKLYHEYNPSDRYVFIPEYPFIKKAEFKDLIDRYKNSKKDSK